MQGIYSFGGFGREIHDFVAASHSRRLKTVFIDDSPPPNEQRQGFEVLTLNQFVESGGTEVVVAFADPRLRRSKTEEVESFGIAVVPSALHPNSEIGARVIFGDGLVMTRGAQITSDAVLGRSVHMNLLSYVAHDCVLGDFVTLSPRASINGRVILQDEVYVGANAVILPGQSGSPLTVGTGAVVGAGAVVTRDVEPGATVVGSPAKAIERK